MRGMAEATSPTDTACNQIEPEFVRVNSRGRKPSRSPKWDKYSRWTISRVMKYKKVNGSPTSWSKR